MHHKGSIYMQNFISHLTKRIELTEEQTSKITDFITIKQFSKGDFILQPGDYSSDFYFIEKGVLRSYTIDENGKEHIIQFGTENWLIGDRNSSLCKEASKFYIQAIEDATIIIVNDELNQLIQQMNPAYLNAQLILLQNHVRHLQDRINSLLSASAKTRYLEFIKLYPTILPRIPQWMIASYLGITPESLSRVRKDIASNG